MDNSMGGETLLACALIALIVLLLGLGALSTRMGALDHDTIGPAATVFASLVAAGVAIVFGAAQYRLARAQKEIAAAQSDLAERRFHYDLHAKRVEIYEATRDMIKMAFSKDHYTEQQFLNKMRVSQACPFFFSKTVSDRHDDAVLAACTMRGVEDRTKYGKELDDAMRTLGKFLDEMPAIFAGEMSFNDLERRSPNKR